jgi:hypothetical protein
MAITENNRELFSQLSELVSEWGLNTVVESLVDVCDENSLGVDVDTRTAWEENSSRLASALDKFYPTR